MKKIIKFCLLLTFSGSLTVIAQAQILTSCKTNNLVFSAKYMEGLGVLYYATNLTTRTTDSMLISQTGSSVTNCFCNDTIASFYVDNYPSPEVKNFKWEKNKWKYINTVTLPQKFPMVGILQENKKYERYTHQLVSIDKVVSELTILMAKDRKLTPIERYGLEYRLIPEKGELLVEKKTQKNE
ncbi:MAG: hypothetical protein JNN28_05695 [Saprospiraceae bacterium]|nr:hypothetical protein [Saprospiraceae bacterium]